MHIKTYSYRFAEEILQHPRYFSIYNEIIGVCRECPLPVYKGKSSVQKGKDIVQQIMNTYFKLRFKSLGWETEPFATPSNNEDALRSDFRKTFVDEATEESLVTLQIEVEFGNVASSYRNYFKFQLSFSYNLTDICILIVPSYRIANRIDTGVANYEKIVREIPTAKLSITVPTLVIGLFDRNRENNEESEWNVRAISEDMDILRGSRRDTRIRHYEIVKDYIDSLEKNE